MAGCCRKGFHPQPGPGPAGGAGPGHDAGAEQRSAGAALRGAHGASETNPAPRAAPSACGSRALCRSFLFVSELLASYASHRSLTRLK